MAKPHWKPDIIQAAAAIESFLAALGLPDNTTRELKDTPQRVVAAYMEDLLIGYSMQPVDILAEHTKSSSRALVVLRNIKAITMCPHHLMPAVGKVHVGYIPGSHVVGFGAIDKLVKCFTRRLELQEDIANNIAAALIEHLGAAGSGCIVDMEPTCLSSRHDSCIGVSATAMDFQGELAQDTAKQQQFVNLVYEQTKP